MTEEVSLYSQAVTSKGGRVGGVKSTSEEDFGSFGGGEVAIAI